METESTIWTFLTIILISIIIFSTLTFSEVYNQSESTSSCKFFSFLIKLSDNIGFEFNQSLT